mmetsp:Transcript_8690/g.18526  ORF Transcript_8690/g.18526 Transcript_8690/m.18526 type:complete len:453 (-) Transcript_8690:22-1380(-)
MGVMNPSRVKMGCFVPIGVVSGGVVCAPVVSRRRSVGCCHENKRHALMMTRAVVNPAGLVRRSGVDRVGPLFAKRKSKSGRKGRKANQDFKGPLAPKEYGLSDDSEEERDSVERLKSARSEKRSVPSEISKEAKTDEELKREVMEQALENVVDEVGPTGLKSEPAQEESFDPQDLDSMLQSTSGRKKLRRAARAAKRASAVEPKDGDDVPLSADESGDVRLDANEVDNPVARLTKRFKLGRDELLQKVEAEPDFMFQKEVARNDTYDLTAAVIGAGRPTKEGTYILPYLQNGHIIGLLIVLLCTFVYYPGFPLTQLPDEAREQLRHGLLITFVVNAVLAIAAVNEAKTRKQPVVFWAVKVFLLGGLALNELQTNTRAPGSPMPDRQGRVDPAAVSKISRAQQRRSKRAQRAASNPSTAPNPSNNSPNSPSSSNTTTATNNDNSSPPPDTFLP